MQHIRNAEQTLPLYSSETSPFTKGKSLTCVSHCPLSSATSNPQSTVRLHGFINSGYLIPRDSHVGELLCLASPIYRDVSEYAPPFISKSQRSPGVTSSTTSGHLGPQEGGVALTRSGLNVTL